MGSYVITGSASGIGAATRARLESAGHQVVGVDLREAEVLADLSSSTGRRQAVAQLLDGCGGKLDGLVCCAGIGPSAASAPVIISVNYFGSIEVLDGLEPTLIAAKAAVVMVASNSATIVPGLPEELVEAMLSGNEGDARWAAESVDGAQAYAASKLALARAVRRRAPKLAEQGLRLNAVAPGAVATPLLQADLEDEELGPLIEALPIPSGGFGSAEQIAGAIAFLLGPDAAFCIGSVLYSDGGTDALIRPDRF